MLIFTAKKISYYFTGLMRTSAVPYRPGFGPRSGHVGFVVENVALGLDFSEYFGLPFPIFIPPTTPHSLIILS
jgi:hypothetical protein